MSADDFYLKATSGIARIDAIELSHPDFPTIYLQNYDDEQDLPLVFDGLEHSHTYAQFEVGRGNSAPDLEQSFTINLYEEVDKINEILDTASHQNPITFRWRWYRSDDYSAPIETVESLVISNISFNQDGFTLSASAEPLNSVATGKMFNLEDYPMLRGTIV